MNALLKAAGLAVLGMSGALHAADIAVLDSSVNTRAYFVNAYEPFRCNDGDWNLGTDEYKRYFMGWEVVLKEMGRDYEVIRDADINSSRLQDFKLLILSNNFWLDDAQMKAVNAWVRRGGRLLATFGTGYQGIEGTYLKGGTNGLHQLWGDPSDKLKSSFNLPGNPWVKLRITRADGPTSNFAVGDVLDYQFMANLLVQRPETSRDINAFFLFNDARTRQPAILNNRHAHGQVVYLAFAPEYLVSLASDVAGHCPNDVRYPESASRQAYRTLATGMKSLMRNVLQHLLNP